MQFFFVHSAFFKKWIEEKKTFLFTALKNKSFLNANLGDEIALDDDASYLDDVVKAPAAPDKVFIFDFIPLFNLRVIV